MPKKECIILLHLTEAFSSVYWNVVFDIIKNAGYKKVIWIDGGLTPGYMYRHIKDLDVVAMQEKNGYEDYHRDIHTLALQTTQLIKYGKILYNNTIYCIECAIYYMP